MRKIVIVGNGDTVLLDSGSYIFENEIAKLLNNLSSRGINITFTEPLISREKSIGLNNFSLREMPFEFLGLYKFSPLRMARVLWKIIIADYVYIFYPGTWPRILAAVRWAIRRPYGLYIRGERFDRSNLDREIVRGASVLCSVLGLSNRLSAYNKSIVTIRPMIEADEGDLLRKDFSKTKNRRLRILFVGRLEPAKGVPELIEACGLLSQRGFDYEVRLVGSGILENSIRDAISTRSIDVDIVGVLQWHSGLKDQYEWADVLILPSHHEGFPRVLIEGMLKSCVVITTMVGGIPNLLSNGVNCISIPVGNASEIARKIEWISSNRSSANAISMAGREMAVAILRENPRHIEFLSNHFENKL